MNTSPNERRSRLDPEPMPRRDFLGLGAIWAMGTAAFFALIGMLRLPRAAVVPAPSRKFRVQIPDSLSEGEAFLPPGRSVAVFRDGEGVFAISRVCTHLGCIVKESPHGFDCPCHGSQFHTDGSVAKGPAPKALPWLAVKKDRDGWVIDEGSTVPPGTKVT